MKIIIYGAECKATDDLYANAEQAAIELNLEYKIKRDDSLVEISEYGISSTPALSLDYKVVKQGEVLSVAEIKAIMKAMI